MSFNTDTSPNIHQYESLEIFRLKSAACVINLEGRIIAANEAHLSLLNYPAHEFIGSNLSDYIEEHSFYTIKHHIRSQIPLSNFHLSAKAKHQCIYCVINVITVSNSHQSPCYAKCLWLEIPKSAFSPEPLLN